MLAVNTIFVSSVSSGAEVLTPCRAMTTDRSAIRDRTLVLRVLVPGLRTRLQDKIATAQEQAVRSPHGSSTSPLHSSSAIVQDLDGVSAVPSSDGSTLWHFVCDGATYPARLTNLPCPVEVQKTPDHAHYYKCSDIGQMLVVYEDSTAMDEAENAPGYRRDGFPSYYHSGLTPPMRRVVERRFERREHAAIAPPRDEVASVEEELRALVERIKIDKPKGKGKGHKASSDAKTRVIEEVEEVVVDYEPWMEDGIEFDEHDTMCRHHPEWWLDPDEERAEEKRRRKEEREAAEAARAAEVADRPPPPAAAEPPAKKKKKKKKKEKKVEVPLDGEPRRGIASKKAREVDEVTQAAMSISQGMNDEDILLDNLEGMDEFDFTNDDLTDLL